MINLMQTNWQKLTEDPVLKDRPYDVETNEHGQLIMTPVSDNHAFYAAEIAFLLRSMLPDGIAQVETPLTTKKGTKSPDVTWCTRAIHDQRKNKVESPLAPEICVEVLSSSNSPEEIDEKINLYFEQGALEVWICDSEGNIRFYLLDRTPVEESSKAPDFPKRIEL